MQPRHLIQVDVFQIGRFIKCKMICINHMVGNMDLFAVTQIVNLFIPTFETLYTSESKSNTAAFTIQKWKRVHRCQGEADSHPALK
jgi:hypothetical protein